MDFFTTVYPNNFQPSHFQENIFQEVEYGSRNIVVKAGAGSGKTKTIELAASFHITYTSQTKVLMLAFNKHIVKELQARQNAGKIPRGVTAMTFHGMCWSTIRYYYKTRGVEVVFLEEKIHLIIKQYVPAWMKDFSGDEEEFSGYISRIKKLVNMMRLNFCQNDKEIQEVVVKYNIAVLYDEIQKAKDVLQRSNADVVNYDYDDMVYQVARNPDMRPIANDFVFGDEVQDWNKAQIHILTRKKNGLLKPNGRFVCVGDPHQCQTPDTLVLLANGTQRLISELQIGDMVVSHNSHDRGTFIGVSKNAGGFAKGRRVNNVANRQYNGKIIKISSENGKTSRYTPNHKCIAKFDYSKCSNKFVVYLMRNEKGWYRIGTTHFFERNGLGPSRRFAQEKATDYWIIGVFDTKQEASFMENYLSIEYGIPEMVFCGRESHAFKFDQMHIDRFYGMLNLNALYERAKNLLDRYGMDINLSFHNHKILRVGGRKTGFAVYATNIMKDYMLIPTFDGTNKPSWQSISSMESQQYNGLVYSLDIDIDHNYVADGILTNNSINGFAGASNDAFQMIVDQPNTVVLPLSISYRCSQAVIRKAKEINPDIDAHPSNPEGECRNGSVEEIQDNDWVLCRTYKPLARLCLKYISEGKKATIKGVDFGLDLIKMITDTKQPTLERVFKILVIELKKLVRKLIDKGLTMDDVEMNTTYIVLREKIEVIYILSKTCQTPEDLINRIKSIFTDNGEGITFCTVHRSKGLESKRIFIIRQDLMPIKWARQEWEIEQEHNLMYVAYTRAMESLIFVTDWSDDKDDAGLKKNIDEKAEEFSRVV